MRARRLTAAAMLVVFTTALFVGGCSTESTYHGAGAGAAVGATAGAMLDNDNSWRGGVVGGALGAVFGGLITEIGIRASREAALQNQPVAYTNHGRGQRVEAYPQGPSSRRQNCQIVKEKYYEQGELVKVTEREVCN